MQTDPSPSWDVRYSEHQIPTRASVAELFGTPRAWTIRQIMRGDVPWVPPYRGHEPEAVRPPQSQIDWSPWSPREQAAPRPRTPRPLPPPSAFSRLSRPRMLQHLEWLWDAYSAAKVAHDPIATTYFKEQHRLFAERVLAATLPGVTAHPRRRSLRQRRHEEARQALIAAVR